MSKIICDICGTKYPETADQCPICGCTRETSAGLLAEELVEEEISAPAPQRNKGGRFAFGRKSGKSSRYDEDYDDDEDDEEEEVDDIDEDEDLYESDYDDDDEDEDDHKSNTPLVILLVIVILALLCVTGFIFVRYFLPNMAPAETNGTEDVIETTLADVETTELSVPCTSLVMTSGGSVELTEIGQNWLINVMALPENTTDKVTYTSSDEEVATVNESGKITAVGEGLAVITITCGDESLICNVSCMFTPAETTAPEVETSAPTDATEGTEATEPVETSEPTEPTAPLKDITLKVLKYTDLTFNAPKQGFTFVVQGLKNNEVKWTSMDEKVVTVDENGVVLSVGKGKTTIICQYGDQKVEITVTCRW